MDSIGLARVAAVLAEPHRTTMCLTLIDGRAWTVGELARTCGIASSTASEHVARLSAAGFVNVIRQGRHSYVRLADSRVAQLVELLAEHTEHREQAPRAGLRMTLQARRLARARVCYDHLAGGLGVALRDGMVQTGLVDISGGLSLTAAGKAVLDELRVVLPHRPGRPMLRDCLDWTERREHFGGLVAAQLLSRAVEAEWLQRARDRSVRIDSSALEPFALLGVVDIDQFLGGSQ